MEIFTFGKYKGKSVKHIINSCPQYITWLLENYKKFEITDEQLNLYNRKVDIKNVIKKDKTYIDLLGTRNYKELIEYLSKEYKIRVYTGHNPEGDFTYKLYKNGSMVMTGSTISISHDEASSRKKIDIILDYLK